MKLEKIYPTGAEEWFCPRCGRRFIMQWLPTCNRMVLEAGDEQACHSGGHSNLVSDPTEINADQPYEEVSVELRLAVEDALAHVDFDDWN
jgi:hypothetical protein